MESYREAALQVVVKPDDGINDGKIRMLATLESCKGNACDALGHGPMVYIVEKGEGGEPVTSVSVFKRWRQGRTDRGAVQETESEPSVGHGRI